MPQIGRGRPQITCFIQPAAQIYIHSKYTKTEMDNASSRKEVNCVPEVFGAEDTSPVSSSKFKG